MKRQKFDLQKIIVSHPAFKELAGSFSLGIKQFSVSQLPFGIRSYFLEMMKNLFGGSFLTTNLELDDENYTLINSNSSYSVILQILNDNEYKRDDSLDEKRTFLLRGDSIYINNPIYSSLIRLEFWGENLERMMLIDDITLKKKKALDSVIISSRELNLIYEEDLFSNVLISFTDNNPDYCFDFKDIHSIQSNFNLLDKQIHSYFSRNFSIFFSTKYSERFDSLKNKIIFIKNNFPEGFVSNELKIVVYTDSELFDHLVLDSSSIDQNYIDISDVKVGDYIVHKNHGVAIYGGVKVVDVDNESREYLILHYAKEDKLYVPRNQVDYVSKYFGINKSPRLSRLGTQEWESVKKRVKKSLESITKELLELYARRELKEGYVFSVNNELINNFVKSFPYEETIDQKKVWQDICDDMESSKPMDRLLVGDVGFGKTEIAMRAAFKVVQDGKQVVLLAPTTVLAEQHYAVFNDRFSNFPIEIAILSRFQKKDALVKSIENIKKGFSDIIIATHKIFSNNIVFKDLGLLIIDEEQRFGVKQKEKLKLMRESLDVLSMSATPIPRSLNMALSGIRDISVLMEPPKGRLPVKTFLQEFDYDFLIRVLQEEKKRSGQSYIIHNNVKTINSFASHLKELDKNLSYLVAHGKMPGDSLSEVMRSFHNKKSDVLICTTIIENGIDIPNVNTMIIDNAQNFGLSQLHQLRGRVGRSGRQASCYLFYPKDSELNDVAKQRLDTLVNSQDLGSGFRIASKDLEIRGSGNFLGREQSGNIYAVGYSLYIQLLKEQIRLMRKIN